MLNTSLCFDFTVVHSTFAAVETHCELRLKYESSYLHASTTGLDTGPWILSSGLLGIEEISDLAPVRSYSCMTLTN